MCLFLLKQTIAQYNHNGSPVFVAFLDASKAFDKENHGVLFKKLVEAKVPMIFVYLLVRWYSSQRSCVKWNSAYSESFSTTNGVRQGSILSPFLFAIYMNELSLILNKLNIGCFIGNQCLNNIFMLMIYAVLSRASRASKNFLIFVVIMQIGMTLLLTVLKLRP